MCIQSSMHLWCVHICIKSYLLVIRSLRMVVIVRSKQSLTIKLGSLCIRFLAKIKQNDTPLMLNVKLQPAAGYVSLVQRVDTLSLALSKGNKIHLTAPLKGNKLLFPGPKNLTGNQQRLHEVTAPGYRILQHITSVNETVILVHLVFFYRWNKQNIPY